MQHPKLEIQKRTAEYTIATYGPVLLQLWQLSTPVDGAKEARRAARKLARAGHEKTGSVVVVPVQSAMPDKEARAELTEIPKELTNGAGLVLVQEGSGFRASAIRAVLSTMMHLSRRAMPHDVAPSVAFGTAWLVERMAIPGGARGLSEAISELRAFYDVPREMRKVELKHAPENILARRSG